MSNLVLDDLFEASFKGATFLFRRGSKEFGRKTITHEYVGTTDRYVEDLSGLDDIFSITAIITGPDYLDKRNSFESALKSKGPGILIHPFYGPVLCALSAPVQLTETPEQLNVASYSLKFSKTIEEARFPAEEEAISATILGSVNSIEDTLKTYISTNFVAATVANFNDAREVLTEITDVLSGTLSSSDTGSETSQLINRIEDFVDNINSYISNPSDLADELLGIFGDWQTVTDEAEVLLSNNSEFLNFGDDYEAPDLITQERIQRDLNRQILNNTSKSISLANYYQAATSVEYFSVDQIAAVETASEAGFQDIPYFDPTIYNDLQKIRNLFRTYAKDQKSTAFSVSEVRVNDMPATILTYKYYGDTEFMDRLAELNGITDVSSVEGDVKVFVK